MQDVDRQLKAEQHARAADTGRLLAEQANIELTLQQQLEAAQEEAQTLQAAAEQRQEQVKAAAARLT